MAKELNETTFKSEVLQNPGPALVDFWAPWCGPCRIMGPIVDNLAKKYEGKVLIAKVNVDENQNLAGQYNIMSIPSLLFIKGGKVVHTHLGATTEADLETQIKQYLL
ncbi:MAG: Thioredoxin [Candidatus Ozemobacter sibiricus]|jgi:thioredoxin 1|uniref:Thioredoxin n=1 Tax=Candidatus Ozemobacter sibiricus TaxID=2268124 RepID=A0A367ZPS8_9BACT|nr:MAG: Thioredoxin [Candidatus Ozemobacter sibiricus]